MNASTFHVRIEYHSPDQHWVAVLERDGEPWFLEGGLVGFGSTPGNAVEELLGVAGYLIDHGENFLVTMTDADRAWLTRELRVWKDLDRESPPAR